MDIKITEWLKKTRSLLPINLGRILDIGSLNVNGSAREVYTSDEYIGIDLREGKDVDRVMNAHDIAEEFGEESFDLVVCMSTLEHDNCFWLTLGAINKVLKRGGYHVSCVPTFHFPIHRHPKDYWRMSEEAVREVIFNGYETLALEEIFTKEVNGNSVNPVICAIGKKEGGGGL
jgi:hypothetical protein